MRQPLLFLLLVFALVAGCQEGNGKHSFANVSGTVTYNGHPIEKGYIQFQMEGNPPTTMDIIDGKFNGQAMVGSNRVSVSAKKKSATAQNLPPQALATIQGYQKVKKGEQGGPSGELDLTMVEYIPPEWGTASKQTRVIEAGSNELQFEIRDSAKTSKTP
jgi:hypothetical protein